MDYIPAANVAMAELRFDFGGQRCENTLYFEASASLSTTLMTTLAADLVGWWKTQMLPHHTTNMALREVFVTDLTTSTSPTVTYGTGLPANGTNGPEALPNNCALCISFRTAARGRTGRGRNYIMGINEGQVNQSTVDPTLVAQFVAAYNDLIGAGGLTAGLQWCVVSRFVDGDPRPAALVRPITAALCVDGVIDSQRRRLPGRGK